MFQLFADSTPNARKVSIMLEEINENYQVSLIDLDKGEQFILFLTLNSTQVLWPKYHQ